MTGAGVKPDGSFIRIENVVWTCPVVLKLRGSKTLKTFIYEINKKAKQNMKLKQQTEKNIFLFTKRPENKEHAHTCAPASVQQSCSPAQVIKHINVL